MNECPVTVFPKQIRWETEGTSRIPFQAYTDEDIHQKELERFFYRNHWCYVGLEAEIPNPGDFKRTVDRRALGDHGARQGRRASTSSRTSARTAACSSAASATATARSFICPYHQWNYTLAGDLQGVPFRRGVKQDGKVNGGMPADFKTSRPRARRS